MKRKLIYFLVTIMALSCVSASAENKVSQSGAVKGVWTMDYDAALKKSKAETVPLLVNFTGSDWCGWCKLMDKNVFSTKEWRDFSNKNLYLVFIDFPKNKKLVPEKYVKRNADLKKKYEISGYPTYLLFNPDGKTLLGTLGAGLEKDGKSFVAEVTALIKTTAIKIK